MAPGLVDLTLKLDLLDDTGLPCPADGVLHERSPVAFFSYARMYNNGQLRYVALVERERKGFQKVEVADRLVRQTQ